MKTVDERHLDMVDAVNDAKTHREHDLAVAALKRFREAMAHFGYHARFLIDADIHTMERFGQDRPMCCGELLDWEPSHD